MIHRATFHDYNRASLNEARGTTLGEYFTFITKRQLIAQLGN